MAWLEIFWSWLVSKVLDRIFTRKEDNTKLLLKYEERFNKLQDEKEQAESERQNANTESRRIIDSLKRTGVSVEKLIDSYDKPLNAILISYASQKEETRPGSFAKKSPFIKEELTRFNSRYLGGTTSLIPPAKVPSEIMNQEDLRKWFEKEILRGRYCKLRFLILLDLKKKTFWKNYLPYTQKTPMHRTIGEVLDLEDIFTEKQINKISLAKIVRDGDISWLASRVLPEKELNIIMKHQKQIEEKLGNLSLRELADERKIKKISNALKEYISDPEEVARDIVSEAKFWKTQLL